MRTRIEMEPVNKHLSLQNVNFKSCFVLCHQTENRFSRFLFNSNEDKCIQSHVALLLIKLWPYIVRHNYTYR